MHGHLNVKKVNFLKMCQRHISALRSHLQVEHKRVYVHIYIYIYIYTYIYMYNAVKWTISRLY